MYAEPMPMALTDRELLERSRARDEHAFAALVGRHQSLLVNYLTRMLGSRERAEDLAQETFVRFYRHLDRYQEQGTLTAFLLRIATNLVRSRERRRQRWRLLQPVFALGEKQRTHPSPQADALASEAQQKVLDAIAGLELRYRAPLVMREIEGLSYRQIAVALETSEGTIKSRLHRARALLKRSLEPYWNGDAR